MKQSLRIIKYVKQKKRGESVADITHKIGIKAPLNKVYGAVSTIQGLSGWWTSETLGDSKPDGQIQFVFKTPEGNLKGSMVMKVTTLEPDKKVQWRCVDGPSEWLGTDIVFDLSEQDGLTIVLFSHRNWKETTEFTYHCSMKWAIFLLSLRDFVLTGKGQPSPRDVKIDNWN